MTTDRVLKIIIPATLLYVLAMCVSVVVLNIQ